MTLLASSTDDELHCTAGGCNTLNSVQHFLEGRPPRVFTMQLVWETNNESRDDIQATMKTIEEVCSHWTAGMGIIIHNTVPGALNNP